MLDLKGAYRGTAVDQPPDPRLYRLVAEAFPEAVLEDPDLVDPGTAEALERHRERISWDAVIHSVGEIEGRRSRRAGSTSSRRGSGAALRSSTRTTTATPTASRCTAEGSSSFLWGEGNQTLASLFHADGPNDVAPLGYDGEAVEPGTPASPLPPNGSTMGFR